MSKIDVIKNNKIGFFGNIPIYLILTEFNPLILNESFRNNDLPFLGKHYISIGDGENHNALLINIRSAILKAIMHYNEIVLKVIKGGKEKSLNKFIDNEMKNQEFIKLKNWTIDKNNWSIQEFIDFREFFNKESLRMQEISMSFESIIEISVGLFLLDLIFEKNIDLDLNEKFFKELLNNYIKTKTEIEKGNSSALIDLFLIPFLVSY